MIMSESDTTDQSILSDTRTPTSLGFFQAQADEAHAWALNYALTDTVTLERDVVILGDISIADVFGDLDGLVGEIETLGQLSRSDEIARLLHEVTEDLPNREQEDVQQWADALANDVAEADD